MTQAILITAYKHVDQLNHLIHYFPDEVNIYIHIDRKNQDISSQIIRHHNVFSYSKFSINWAGFNHLKAILFLSETVLKNENNAFFHLISGEDYPCAKDFNAFQNSMSFNLSYLDYFSMPYQGWNGNGGLDRVNKYHLNDVWDAKKTEDLQLMNQIVYMQTKEGILPREDFREEFKMERYGGSTWWSLNRKVLKYVIRFTQERTDFFHRFENTFCAEEIPITG